MVTCAKLISLLENGVLENCQNMGDYLGDQLRKMQKSRPQIGDVRQAGLHIGVEFVKDPVSKEPIVADAEKIRMAGFRNGLFLGIGGVRKNVLKIKPPLIVTRAECDEILERFERSMCEVLGK
jgi:4-aminobutyrate aminotransferase-like enzyme